MQTLRVHGVHPHVAARGHRDNRSQLSPGLFDVETISEEDDRLAPGEASKPVDQRRQRANGLFRGRAHPRNDLLGLLTDLSLEIHTTARAEAAAPARLRAFAGGASYHLGQHIAVVGQRDADRLRLAHPRVVHQIQLARALLGGVLRCLQGLKQRLAVAAQPVAQHRGSHEDPADIARLELGGEERLGSILQPLEAVGVHVVLVEEQHEHAGRGRPIGWSRIRAASSLTRGSRLCDRGAGTTRHQVRCRGLPLDEVHRMDSLRHAIFGDFEISRLKPRHELPALVPDNRVDINSNCPRLERGRLLWRGLRRPALRGRARR